VLRRSHLRQLRQGSVALTQNIKNEIDWNTFLQVIRNSYNAERYATGRTNSTQELLLFNPPPIEEEEGEPTCLRRTQHRLIALMDRMKQKAKAAEDKKKQRKPFFQQTRNNFQDPLIHKSHLEVIKKMSMGRRRLNTRAVTSMHSSFSSAPRNSCQWKNIGFMDTPPKKNSNSTVATTTTEHIFSREHCRCASDQNQEEGYSTPVKNNCRVQSVF
jgi:hypothetical protein